MTRSANVGDNLKGFARADVEQEWDGEAERWNEVDIRLAAVTLIARLPTHNINDARAVLEYAGVIFDACVIKKLAA